MIRINSARGDLVIVSLYPGCQYSSDTIREVLDVAKSVGMKSKFASFYNVAPAKADPMSLHAGDLDKVRVDLVPSGGGASLPDLVLAECTMDWTIANAVVELRLRTKFYGDGTFSVNFDLPYSNVFEGSLLSTLARRFVWFNVEALSQVAFESADFLYGGIYWERETPSLGDLAEHERTLPLDFALYSRRVVDSLGRTELLARLRDAASIRLLKGGCLYFAWSPGFEQAESANVPSDFSNFVRLFQSVGVLGR
jgi:hypothetical protein